MKKYKKIILVITAALGVFVSCEDELEQSPENSLTTDNFFNTSADFRL